MERNRVLATGLAAAGVGNLYVSPFVLAFSTLDAVLTVVVGLGLLQAAAGAEARDAWGVGVGVATAAAASLPGLQVVLFGSVSVWSVAGAVGTLGLVLLAGAVVGWALAGSPRNPDPERWDEGRAVGVLRGACAVAAASGLLYGGANLAVGNPLILPGNLLVAAGFGLPAAAVRPPLFGGRPGRDAAEAGSPS